MAKFSPGTSGNPGGRPRGAKTAAKLIPLEFITEQDVQAIVASVVAAAKDGDLTAAALVLDRVLPKLRPAPFGGIEAEAELAEAVAAARVRAVKSAGIGNLVLSILTGVTAADEPQQARGSVLETLVAQPDDEPRLPAATEPRPPAAPQAAVDPPPAVSATPAPPLPRPPLRLALSERGGRVLTDYDPYNN